MSSEKFHFPDIDQVGIETLDVISFAPRFNKWMYKTIAPFTKGNILEVGSGIGNISQFFIDQNAQISLTDIRDNYVTILKEKYKSKAHEVFKLDLAAENFETTYKDRLGSYDSIFALNVVEHIEDDVLAIKNAKKLLKTDGHLIILVPAYNWLYNSFDLALEHYRRYTRKTLNKLLSSAEFKIIHNQYFNAFGMLGWFVSGKILKKKSIPRNQMELYDRLIFIAKTIDKINFNSFGLSVISIGKK